MRSSIKIVSYFVHSKQSVVCVNIVCNFYNKDINERKLFVGCLSCRDCQNHDANKRNNKNVRVSRREKEVKAEHHQKEETKPFSRRIKVKMSWKRDGEWATKKTSRYVIHSLGGKITKWLRLKWLSLTAGMKNRKENGEREKGRDKHQSLKGMEESFELRKRWE